MKAIYKNAPLLILVSAVFFGLMAVLVKIASKSLPSGEIAFVRFLGGFILIYSVYRVGLIKIRIINKKFLILRGILAGFAVLLYFSSINLIPVGNAATLNCTYPIFATIFSIIFLRERARLDAIGTLLLSFIGVFLVIDPSFRGLSIGDILGLSSGILAGASITVIRELRKTETAFSVFYFFSLIGSFITAPTVLIAPRVPDLWCTVILLLLITTSTLGQLTISYAMKYSPAGEGSITSMATVVVSSLLGYIILGDAYSTNFFLGASLILGSGLYLSLRPARPFGLPTWAGGQKSLSKRGLRKMVII